MQSKQAGGLASLDALSSSDAIMSTACCSCGRSSLIMTRKDERDTGRLMDEGANALPTVVAEPRPVLYESHGVAVTA